MAKELERIKTLLKKYPPSRAYEPKAIMPIKVEPPRYEVIQPGPKEAAPYTFPIGPIEVEKRPYDRGLLLVVKRKWKGRGENYCVKAYYRLIPARWIETYRRAVDLVSKSQVDLDTYWGPAIKNIPRSELLRLIPREELERLRSRLPGMLKFLSIERALEHMPASWIIEALGVDTILKYIPEAAVKIEPVAPSQPIPPWQRLYAAMLSIPEAMTPSMWRAITGLSEELYNMAVDVLHSKGLVERYPATELPYIHDEPQIGARHIIKPLDPEWIAHTVIAVAKLTPEKATPSKYIAPATPTPFLDRYVYQEIGEKMRELELWKALPVDVEGFIQPPSKLYTPREGLATPFRVRTAFESPKPWHPPYVESVMVCTLEWNIPSVWFNPEKKVEYVSWYPPDSPLWSPPEYRTENAFWRRKASTVEFSRYLDWLRKSWIEVDNVRKPRLAVLHETAEKHLDRFIVALRERLPPSVWIERRFEILK